MAGGYTPTIIARNQFMPNTSNNKDGATLQHGQPIVSEQIVAGGNGAALWTETAAQNETSNTIEGGEVKPTSGYQRATKIQFQKTAKFGGANS